LIRRAATGRPLRMPPPQERAAAWRDENGRDGGDTAIAPVSFSFQRTV